MAALLPCGEKRHLRAMMCFCFHSTRCRLCTDCYVAVRKRLPAWLAVPRIGPTKISEMGQLVAAGNRGT
jgi:hypothetical protein